MKADTVRVTNKITYEILPDFQLGLSKTDIQFPCLLNALKSGYYFYLLGMKKIRPSKTK